MKLAAARAIAGVIPESELGPEYIVPSVFNRAWRRRSPTAVAHAAIESGIARRDRRRGSDESCHRGRADSAASS